MNTNNNLFANNTNQPITNDPISTNIFKQPAINLFNNVGPSNIMPQNSNNINPFSQNPPVNSMNLFNNNTQPTNLFSNDQINATNNNIFNPQPLNQMNHGSGMNDYNNHGNSFMEPIGGNPNIFNNHNQNPNIFNNSNNMGGYNNNHNYGGGYGQNNMGGGMGIN